MSRDLAASRDAIGPGRIDAKRDPGIIESRIPTEDFDKVLKSSEREYPGFNSGLKGSTEVVLRTPEQIELFNRHILGLIE